MANIAIAERICTRTGEDRGLRNYVRRPRGLFVANIAYWYVNP